MTEFNVENHFENKSPVVREIYEGLIKKVKSFGEFQTEPHKTSIHLLNQTAFAGVATRKAYLILTIKSDHKLSSPRIHKTEQVSARRFHSEVKLTSPTQVDTELISWLKEAYALSA
jgi:hypothetical protein